MNPEDIHEQLSTSRLSTEESPRRPNTSTVSAYESQLEISMISANKDDDAEVSLWIDEKEQQHERRGVINHAISQLPEGRYSPVALTLTAPFNNMPTLKFKAQPTNAFFVTVDQMFGGSSQLLTTAEQ